MKHTLIITLLILLAGCSLQKRRYQKGFYISNNRSQQAVRKAGASTRLVQSSPVSEKAESYAVTPAINKQPEPDLTASASEFLPHRQRKSAALPDHHPSIAYCDMLILMDGSELQVRIVETTVSEIKYKKCDSPDDALYTAQKTDLFMAKYSDGTKELFNPEKTGQTPDITVPRTTHSMATLSLIFGIVGIFLYGSIPAIILGSLALKRIREKPQEYDGNGQAVAGIILGGVGILVKVIVILLIIAILLI